MPRSELFLDSSALLSGIISESGAARALLLMGEAGQVRLLFSEQVLTEVERNLARKIARALPLAREMILASDIEILRDPPRNELAKRKDWIRHEADLPILVAAFLARVDFLVTLNRKHFVDDLNVSRRSGLTIGTPGDALAWVRGRLAAGE